MNRKAFPLVCLLAILLLTLIACGNSPDGGKDGDVDHPNLVDHGDSVSITFPREMFEGVDLSAEFIEVNDYIDAVKNKDGTVTVTMGKDKQKLFLDAFKGDVDHNIAYFIEEVDYLKEITYTDDFRSMRFLVDGDTDQDILLEFPYIFCYPFEQYQLMLGQEVHFIMTVCDAETGETLAELSYPDDL